MQRKLRKLAARWSFILQNDERRIAALESQENTVDVPKFVIVRVGETKAEALMHAGYALNAENVRYVVFAFPPNAKL